MNKIKVVDKNSNLITWIEDGSFVPNVGEYLWLDSTVENADSRKVTERVIDVDKNNRRFIITLVVE